MSEVPLYTPLSFAGVRCSRAPTAAESLVQGYLANKKTHPPRSLPLAYV